MDDARAMGLVERRRDLDRVPKGFLHREAGPREALDERLSVEILHDEEVGAVVAPDVVQCADVRMIQRGHGARLALEALAGLRVVGDVGGQNFDSNIAVEPRVARFVDLAHPAGPESRANRIRSQLPPSQ